METVNNFINKFTIDPEVDIIPHFTLTKKYESDAGIIGDCLHCGDKSNNKRLISSSWTGVQYCWKCNHLNVVYYADRMSGVYTNTVKCFTEK